MGPGGSGGGCDSRFRGGRGGVSSGRGLVAQGGFLVAGAVAGIAFVQRHAGRDDLVERGDAVAGADLAGVLGVVVEVARGEHAVLVADQAVGGNLGRVELDLDLDVLGDGHQGPAELGHQHLLRLGQGVDVGVVAVALVGQHLQRLVLVVAHAVAERGQEDAAAGLVLDQPLQVVQAGHADVEVTIGGQDHPVDAAFDEMLGRDVVSLLDAAGTVGRAAGLQAIDGVQDCAPVAAGRGRQGQAGLAGVGDDRHAVARPQLLDQHGQRLLDQVQLVRVHHRARDVDQEDQVAVGPRRALDLAALDADSHQPVLRPPGRLGHRDVDREGVFAAGRRRGVVVVEVVDHLLDPHRVRRRQRAELLDEAAHVGVGRRVDVDREGRQRLLVHTDEGVVDGRRVGFGVGGRLGGRRVARLPVNLTAFSSVPGGRRSSQVQYLRQSEWGYGAIRGSHTIVDGSVGGSGSGGRLGRRGGLRGGLR